MSHHYQIVSGPDHGSPVWLGRDRSVWGPAAPDKHGRWDTEEEAQMALTACELHTIAFYGLRIVRVRSQRTYDRGNGWMVGHPGYDLMY